MSHALSLAVTTPEGAPAQDKIDKISKLFEEKAVAKSKPGDRADFRSFLKN